MTTSKLTKKTLAALEKVFAAEIEGRMLQSRATIYEKLAEEGLVVRVQQTLGSGPFPVVCHGFMLTHAGRYLYCSAQ
jgi:hypothetical protein